MSGLDLCTGWGTPTGSGLVNALAGSAAPQIVSNSLVLATETCPNNAVDPGETVTMDFALINTGSANTTNLVATLQASGGITSPSAAQTYGALTAGGSAVNRPFTFTASGTCGGTITATLQLQDGAANLGTVTFNILLGAMVTGTTLSENFDEVSAPALPSGWTTTVVSGIATSWSTTNGFYDTAPNSAFVSDTLAAGEAVLVAPMISIQSPSAQVTFRHNYNLAVHTTLHHGSTTYDDGGALEISIGGGAFTDIIAAGGSFSTGGYNCILASGTSNPLGGRQAWGGSSGGWVTTTANLPAAAAGQTLQLRWSCGTGVNTSPGVGWFVDSISLQDSSFQCCVPSADLGVNQNAAPDPAAADQNLTYTLVISNAGPSAASSIAVTDSLPAGVTFVSASPGCINLGGAIACTIATLAGGSTNNILVTVKPNAEGTLTNTVSVTSGIADPNTNNNVSVFTTAVYTPPSITAQPTNQVTMVGGNANFYVTATGTTPLTYQWTFGGAPLAGATANTLSLANVQASQAGNYSLVATNSAGAITSAVAQLTVLMPPSITSQPTNQTVAAGSIVNFQVTATGSSPLSYQWWFDGTNAVGISTNLLTLTNVQAGQAGNYSVTITNPAGSVNSSVATLTIGLPPSITAAPSSVEVVQGQPATFNVAATGDAPLSYQWQFNGSPLNGDTNANCTLAAATPSNAGNYNVMVSNAYGQVTSAVAKLQVVVSPLITGVNPGANAVSVTVSTVTGLAYQLQYKDSLNDSAWTAASPWMSATGAALVLQDTNAVSAGRFYRVGCQ